MQTKDKQKLVEFFDKIQHRASSYIGYPAGADFNYEELYPFLKYCLNNVGDPFVESFDMHTKEFEREVLSFFADLFQAPKNNWWGYVTSGGSEGNLYALYLARELHPKGIVYYSEATHYSIQKNVHLLGMTSIVIRSDEKGEIDYEDLKETIHMNRQRPTIILANIGTTMTEAKDNVATIKHILKSCAIHAAYIHADAALSGLHLSVLQKGSFNFRDGVDSITISGHKFIGSPITSGVVIVKKSYKDRIGRTIPYIGSLDTTISGSRNGITPLFLWYAIKKWGREGLLNKTLSCLDLAAYTESELKKSGIAAWRNQDALTVVFPLPAESICMKWQLATEGEIAHLICMPGITKYQIDEFIHDIKNSEDKVFHECVTA